MAQRWIIHHNAKFNADWSNWCRDVALFTITKIACLCWPLVVCSGHIIRDRTNRLLLFRDRISNCTNLFRPEPNHTRDSRVCSWLTMEVKMLLTYMYHSTMSRVSYRRRLKYTSYIEKRQHWSMLNIGDSASANRQFIDFVKYSKKYATTSQILRQSPGKTTHAALMPPSPLAIVVLAYVCLWMWSCRRSKHVWDDSGCQRRSGLRNIDGKCHTAARHTRYQGLIANMSNRVCPAQHGLWRDVTDVCPASYVRDGMGALSETVATVYLSTLQCLDCPSCAGSPVVSEWGSRRAGEGGPCRRLDWLTMRWRGMTRHLDDYLQKWGAVLRKQRPERPPRTL